MPGVRKRLALSPSRLKYIYGEGGGGGGARRRSTSALESGVGSGITPVASCHAETRRLDEACLTRGVQRSGSRPASKTNWCLDTRPDVAPGVLHSASQHALHAQWSRQCDAFQWITE